MDQEILNFYVVEYSVAEECLHIHQVWQMLDCNRRITFAGFDNDYKPIGVFKTQKEANSFADKLRDGKMKETIQQFIKPLHEIKPKNWFMYRG